MPQNQGSLYKIKKSQLSLMRGYSDLHFLSSAENKFLMGLMELCQSQVYTTPEPEALNSVDVSRGQLISWLKDKNVGSSPTIVKRRSQDFVNYGLFSKGSLSRPGTPPIDVFSLNDLGDVIALNPDTSEFADHRPHRNKLKDMRNQLVIADAQILDRNLHVQYARSERLWNGVFGSCMRTSFKDGRKTDPFTTTYQFGKDPIDIVTSAQSDSEIAHVNDLRTIRAIMTLVCISVKNQTDNNLDVKNEFFIDIVDLCMLMGLDGSGSNRNTIRKSMDRLYSTNFHIKLDSSSEGGQDFIDFFGFNVGTDDFNCRFLTEMDSSLDREFGGGVVRHPRWYRIVLHSKSFQDLLNPNAHTTFIDNKDILRLSSGLLHLFYSWVSRRCGRHGHVKATVSIQNLQRQLLPGRRDDNFRANFVGQLKDYTIKSGGEWVSGEANRTSLFGYKIQIQPHPTTFYEISCWRDKKDRVVGDGSHHNRLLSEKQAKLEFVTDS